MPLGSVVVVILKLLPMTIVTVPVVEFCVESVTDTLKG